mgnify:FL=1|tara:strand:+ start:772 stop:1218 length:447 start_codon:yes stop_codon:yes gene_type:complete
MTDKNDYTFMKSGHDNLVQPDNTQENIEYLVGTYAANAIQHASLYVKHCNRNVLTTEDIKRALIMETMCLKSRDMEAEIQKFKENFDEEAESSDEDEAVSFDSEEGEFTLSTCECPLCKCINTIYTRWDKFSPNSLIETILKKRIDEM